MATKDDIIADLRKLVDRQAKQIDTQAEQIGNERVSFKVFWSLGLGHWSFPCWLGNFAVLLFSAPNPHLIGHLGIVYRVSPPCVAVWWSYNSVISRVLPLLRMRWLVPCIGRGVAKTGQMERLRV